MLCTNFSSIATEIAGPVDAMPEMSLITCTLSSGTSAGTTRTLAGLSLASKLERSCE
jgi:hypothetical protein